MIKKIENKRDNKIILSKIAKLKRGGKKVVLAHGVFDLFHYGHLKYLEESKKMGDILVVSVTADEYVDKGLNRPYFTLEKRIEFLEKIKFINFVIPSFKKTAVETINQIKPNVYSKGKDYKKLNINKNVDLKREIFETKKNGGIFKIAEQNLFSSTTLLNNFFIKQDNIHRKIISRINKKFSLGNITENFEKLKKKKILVVGDVIIDSYINTKSLGKSRKSNLISTRYQNQEQHDGGILLALKIFKQFFNKIDFFIPCSKSENKFLSKKFGDINLISPIVSKNTFVKKQRFIDSYNKNKLFQVNYNDKNILSNDDIKKINYKLKTLLNKNYDAVIMIDFGHQYIKKDFVDLINKCKSKKFVNCQTNSSNFGFNLIGKYNNINFFTCDEDEYRLSIGNDSDDLLTAINKSKKLNQRFKNLVITAGVYGCYFVNKKNIKYVPALKTNYAIDNIGCGDVFFCFYSMLNLLKKYDEEQTALLCHLAASLHSQIFGNSKIIKKESYFKALKNLIS
jgi:rfaE bifunctional protein nucleotidyltransferase chain/domain